jgi:hypothetical protein
MPVLFFARRQGVGEGTAQRSITKAIASAASEKRQASRSLQHTQFFVSPARGGGFALIGRGNHGIGKIGHLLVHVAGIYLLVGSEFCLLGHERVRRIVCGKACRCRQKKLTRRKAWRF